MAATLATCVGCGSDFVASRSHAQWCSDRCRKATSRAEREADATWPASMTVLEAKVAGLVHHRGILPEDAVLFLVRRWPQRPEQVAA